MKAIAILTAITLAGCSFFWTSSHPSTTEDGAVVCEGGGAIVIDALVGVVGLGLGAAAILGGGSSSYEYEGVAKIFGGALIAVTLPWSIGAVVGIKRSGECHRELARAAKGVQ